MRLCSVLFKINGLSFNEIFPRDTLSVKANHIQRLMWSFSFANTTIQIMSGEVTHLAWKKNKTKSYKKILQNPNLTLKSKEKRSVQSTIPFLQSISEKG